MTSKTATNLMLGLVSVVIVFHLSILFKIIPYEITWGGRLKNDMEMYVFESFSIIINLFLGITLHLKRNSNLKNTQKKVVNVILWVFLLLFLLNSIGNLLAETYFEKSFTILTLGFSYLIWIIVKKRKKH
ncbi:MAG: heme/copper-type cytochrome/quinol oxidase subunit 4 [Glaciecola sp.]|jgi:heme/copper-type cytochrome/quinol oxidase subunit 4